MGKQRLILLASVSSTADGLTIGSSTTNIQGCRMDNTLILHSFGTNDRSGKVRWLAHELGLPITEQKVAFGAQRQYPYRDLNPFAAVPTVQWRGQTLIESEAILTYIAEQYPEQQLFVLPTEPSRADFLQWQAISCTTLEAKLVEYTLAAAGILPAEIQPLTEKTLRFKLRIVTERLPQQGFLVADRFTVADIHLAYSLRLAVSSKLLDWSDVAHYLEPLMARPAAQQAEFFGSIQHHPVPS